MYHKVYDKDGKSVPESNNLLEFLWATDWNHLPQCDRNMGAADSVTNKSKIAEISLLKDTEIVW